MKLSFCTTGCKKKHIFDIISFAKEHSFEGIELWYGHAKQYIEEITRSTGFISSFRRKASGCLPSVCTLTSPLRMKGRR